MRRRRVARVASEPEHQLVTSESRRREQRSTIVSLLVAALIGVSFQEMVSAVGEELRDGGVSGITIALAIVFAATALRFFIGATLHLTSADLLGSNGRIWLFDLVVILVEAVLIVFLGGVASEARNDRSQVSFFALLLVLFAVDILWVVSQSVLSRVARGWRRAFVPWAWAGLNIGLVICVGIAALTARADASIGYAVLAVSNLIGAVVDIVLLDVYDVI